MILYRIACCWMRLRSVVLIFFSFCIFVLHELSGEMNADEIFRTGKYFLVLCYCS